MAQIDRKPPTHPAGKALRAAFAPLSKAALIDLIGDLLDAQHGEGQWSIADAIDDAVPRLRIRGDREPSSWAPGVLRRLPIRPR